MVLIYTTASITNKSAPSEKNVNSFIDTYAIIPKIVSGYEQEKNNNHKLQSNPWHSVDTEHRHSKIKEKHPALSPPER